MRGNLLAQSLDEPPRLWALIELASEAIVQIRVAPDVVRFSRMERESLEGPRSLDAGEVFYEAETFTVYQKFSRAPQSADENLGTPERLRAAVLGWLIGSVIDVPSINVLRITLPITVGGPA